MVVLIRDDQSLEEKIPCRKRRQGIFFVLASFGDLRLIVRSR